MTAVQIRTPLDQNGNGLPVGRLDSSRAVHVGLAAAMEVLDLEPGVWLIVPSVNALFAQKPAGTSTGGSIPVAAMSQFWASVAAGDLIEMSALDPAENGFAIATPLWSA